LDDVSKRVDGQLQGQPEVEATVRRTIGVAYRRLGLPDKGEPQLKQALELRRRVLGPKHEKVAESLIDYAWNLAAGGRHAPAEACVREALAIYRGVGEPPLPMIQALWALQWLQVYQGKHAESEETAREALAFAGRSPHAECAEVANILHTLADSRNDRLLYSAAEAPAREALDRHRKVHGAEHPETAWGCNALARALVGMGRYAEAEPLYREELGIFRARFGDRHKILTVALRGLALCLSTQGKVEGLESLIIEMLPDQTRAVEQDPKDGA